VTAAKKTAAPKAEKKDEKGSGITVTAPLIAVPVGEQVLQFREGDVLPNGIDADVLERLTNRGFIAEQ
jgi:hypothetical protein